MADISDLSVLIDANALEKMKMIYGVGRKWDTEMEIISPGPLAIRIGAGHVVRQIASQYDNVIVTDDGIAFIILNGGDFDLAFTTIRKLNNALMDHLESQPGE